MPRYQSRSAFRTLLNLYRGQVHRLLLALFFYTIMHSGVWAMPLVTANIIDIIAQPEAHSLSQLWLYGAFLAVIYVQNVPTHTIYVHYLSTANRATEARLRSVLVRQLQNLSMSYHFRTSTGELQTKLLRDVEQIELLTRQLFETVPVTLITLLIAMIATLLRVPLFLLFFVGVIPPTLWLMKRMQTPLESRNRVFRLEVERMSTQLIEMLHLIPVTRAHGIEQDAIARVETRLETVRDSGVRLDKINALFGASSWVVLMLANTLCLMTAAYFAFTQVIPVSVGDVVLLTSYFGSITGSVSALLALVPQITKGFESVYSLAEVLDSPDIEHNAGKPRVHAVQGRVTLECVGFTYPDTDEHALSDVSLDVQPGETIALVGPSGAGKSTLLNLMIGFIRPSSGRILLDDVDMNTIDLRSYRRWLSVVPQQTALLRGSVRENITYGLDDVSEAALWQAVRDANAADFIQALPQGMDTLIGEDGARLSGGQRQRIAIARALIRQPRVLILDEATSALDTRSEALIQEALGRLMQGRTTFVVAHRLSTVRSADRIVVMDQGRIIEVGSHRDLLQRGGLYANLHNVRLDAV